MTEKELILTNILNCSRASLYTEQKELDKQKLHRFEEITKLRNKGYPLQYIFGECEFMGLVFKVNENVLIPRPETEILAEKAINIVLDIKQKTHTVRILDIGTGCGNIAVSLAKFIDNAVIFATDISDKALEVAYENARLNGVCEKIEFIESDLFYHGSFDIIVSNPPYIPSLDIGSLQKEISYEPRIALDGGMDGLHFYRRVIKEAPKYLNPEGFLIMEMGYNQRTDIENIFRQNKNFDIIEVVKDYSNIDRVIISKLKFPVTSAQ